MAASLHPLRPLPRAPGLSAAALVQAADALACPLLLLDAQRHLLHANRAGRQLLDAGAWLQQAADGRVTAHPRAQSQALRRAVTRAAQGERPLLDAPAGSGLGAASISRLPAAARDGAGAAAHDTAPAMLLLALGATGAGSAGGGLDLKGYAALHRLTRGETRVLAALVQGRTPAQVAQSQGVALATARSQIAALRRKTGQHRLAALLADVARLPPLCD